MPLDPDQIDKPAQKLRKLLKKLPRNPSPEQVHKFRTNARKFEAITSAHHVCKDDSKQLKHLSKLHSQAGKVRDMDVLTAYAAELTPDGAEKQCSVQLLEHLGVQRQKHADKFRKSAKRFSPRLRTALKRASRELQKRIGQADFECRN